MSKRWRIDGDTVTGPSVVKAGRMMSTRLHPGLRRIEWRPDAASNRHASRGQGPTSEGLWSVGEHLNQVGLMCRTGYATGLMVKAMSESGVDLGMVRDRAAPLLIGPVRIALSPERVRWNGEASPLIS